MSKKIAIIESDAGFSSKLKAELEGKGFGIVDTGDGKAALDLVKREKPDLIILSVELSAGQSGYIICGKLKKDDELKKIPVVIIGRDAEGFESHKRLKARAEEYVKKPFDPASIVEKIGNLIGLPEPKGGEVIEDESLGLGALGEDEPLVDKKPAETRADPDLDMLDAAFEGISEVGAEGKSEEPVSAPPDEGLLEEPPPSADAKLDLLGAGAEAAVDGLKLEDKVDEVNLDAIEPVEEAPKIRMPSKLAPVAPLDDGELHSLRAKVSELEGKVRELEDQVAEKSNELDAFKSTTGGKDKEFFALKEQVTKKDKEILRLKGEVNEKDQKLIELEEKQNTLEQKNSELTTESAKKDAQIKTLTTRSESQAKERKSLDATINTNKDEIRQLTAKLSAAQGELDQAQETISELSAKFSTAQSEASSSKTALEALKGEFEQAKSSGDEAKEKVKQLESEVSSLRIEADRAAKLDDEAQLLRKRIAEMEDELSKLEDRADRAEKKLRSEEKVREKVKKSLATAMEALDSSPSAGADGELTEAVS